MGCTYVFTFDEAVFDGSGYAFAGFLFIAVIFMMSVLLELGIH